MLYIHGVGHFHPETVIDNAFLESLDIGTTDEWIVDRVGIRQRHTVLPLDYIRQTRNADPRAAHEASQYTNAQTAAGAAAMALTRAGLPASAMGMVVAGGCSPQYQIPAEACIVAAELEIEVPALDIGSACSTFVAQIDLIERLRPEAVPDFVLLVSAENNTRVVDYTDRNTAVLWGDGTSAAVISTRVPAPAVVRHTTFASAPADWAKVRIPAGGFFAQDGAAVQRFAIRQTVATVRALVEAESPDNPWFIGHQANLGMLRAAASRIGLDGPRHLYNVDRFGNCGAAGAPSVLSEHWDRFAAGDQVLLAVVGSGLSWGGALIALDAE